MAGRGRISKNIATNVRRQIGKEHGTAKAVAAKFNVSKATVYAARDFVRREAAGEKYDEGARVWT